MEGDRKPRPLLRTAFAEGDAAVSPDGRWFAYVSRESGSPEVYVQPFPGPGRKWRVSTGGGEDPDWSRSGRELFYVSGDRLMSVAVSMDPTFSASTPRPLFEASFGEKGLGSLVFSRSLYAVSPDGQRFLIRRGQTPPSSKELRVVLNWADELRRLAPPGGATAR